MAALEIRTSYPDSDPSVARKALRNSANELSQRGLASSAKWSLELLNCVPRSTTSSNRQRQQRDEAATITSSFNPSYLSTPLRKNSRNHQLQTQSSLSRFVHPLTAPNHSTPALGSNQSLHPNDHSTSTSTSGRFPPPSPLIHVSNSQYNKNLDPDSSIDSNQDMSAVGGGSNHVHFAPSADSSQRDDENSAAGSSQPSAQELNEEEEDVFTLAKSHFDSHQLERCSALLESLNSLNPKATFLRLYARFLVSERRIEEHSLNSARLTGKLPAASPNLIPLLSDLVDPSDPFLLYLKGIIFRKLHKRVEAMDCFIRSVQILPYNWGAWKELSATLDGETTELEEIVPLLPDSFMTSFFIEYNTRESSINDVGSHLKRIESLCDMFPRSAYLMVAKGEHLYKANENEACQLAFESALSLDPWRLDGISDYSNSLFVSNQHAKLAELAHRLSEVGKDSTEVCCCIGNYYGSIGDHIRAIAAFKRALRLDSGNSGAWILLGHEYVELKNPHAAAEMYRRGAEINPGDFRAWSGLGKIYELHEAWTYALFYHQRAVALRPYDSRMWNALADTYERLRRPKETISSYQRMLSCLSNLAEQVDIISKIIKIIEKEDSAKSNSIQTSDSNSGCASSISWHRRLVNLVERSQSTPEPLSIGFYAKSYFLVARSEMGDLIFEDQDELEEQDDVETQNDLQVNKDSKEGSTLSQEQISIKRAERLLRKRQKLEKLKEESRGKNLLVGNPHLANDLLLKVAASSPDLMERAEELLKKLAFMRD